MLEERDSPFHHAEVAILASSVRVGVRVRVPVVPEEAGQLENDRRGVPSLLRVGLHQSEAGSQRINFRLFHFAVLENLVDHLPRTGLAEVDCHLRTRERVEE